MSILTGVEGFQNLIMVIIILLYIRILFPKLSQSRAIENEPHQSNLYSQYLGRQRKSENLNWNYQIDYTEDNQPKESPD